MSSHSLSLVHPESPENTQEAFVNFMPLGFRSPLGPPPDIEYTPLSPPPQVTHLPHHQATEVIEIPDSPLSPPPAAAPLRRARAPRRCSTCRLTGHNSRNCPEVRQVINPRNNLMHIMRSRVLQRVPDLYQFPDLRERIYEKINLYVFELSARQLRLYTQNPQPAVIYAYRVTLDEVDSYALLHNRALRRPAPQAPPRSALGAVHAKNIAVELHTSSEELTECEICFEQKCHVKTGCGHLFCGGCVVSIINENKHKTKPPICSFCRAPFTKFTVSSSSVHAEICEFIQNLA